MTHILKSIIISSILGFTLSSYAYELKGQVIGVADGDTLTLLENNTQHKIRMSGIDAPESKQPFGSRSKQYLSDLIFGKHVIADCETRDRYGRDVCTIYLGKTDVNKSLVENGYAWVYDSYNKRDDLPYLQAQAKAAKVGLWGQPEAQIVNPSDWRKGKRAVQQQVREERERQSIQADYTCGSKKYCKQMASCEEAKFYLNQCGVKSLDRDKDGIPCEAVCK